MNIFLHRLARRYFKYFYSMMISIVLGVIVTYFGNFIFANFDLNRAPANSSVPERISQLSEMQKSLKSLDSYIVNQKELLKNYDKNISDLQAEKEKLSAAVQVDRKSVEALAAIINGNQNSLMNYIFGFAVGVISSVIGNIITNRLKTKKVSMTEQV